MSSSPRTVSGARSTFADPGGGVSLDLDTGPGVPLTPTRDPERVPPQSTGSPGRLARKAVRDGLCTGAHVPGRSPQLLLVAARTIPLALSMEAS